MGQFDAIYIAPQMTQTMCVIKEKLIIHEVIPLRLLTRYMTKNNNMSTIYEAHGEMILLESLPYWHAHAHLCCIIIWLTCL